MKEIIYSDNFSLDKGHFKRFQDKRFLSWKIGLSFAVTFYFLKWFIKVMEPTPKTFNLTF